jgi:MYXO-CTERM domain-containing protein
VDADDYFLIDNAFILQTGLLSSDGVHAVAVPEPGMLGLISLAGALLIRRRARS